MLLLMLIGLNITVEPKLVGIVLPKNLVLLALVDVRPHHLELSNYLHCLSNIQTKRLERLVDENLTLLSDLIFRNAIQICKRLVQEGSDVLNLLKDLSIITLIDILH